MMQTTVKWHRSNEILFLKVEGITDRCAFEASICDLE